DKGNVLPATATNIMDQQGVVIGRQLVYQSVAGQTYLVHVSTPGAGIKYSLTVGSLTGDLGTSVQGTEQGTLQTADSAVYRLQTGVAGSLYVTLTAGSD